MTIRYKGVAISRVRGAGKRSALGVSARHPTGSRPLAGSVRRRRIERGPTATRSHRSMASQLKRRSPSTSCIQPFGRNSHFCCARYTRPASALSFSITWKAGRLQGPVGFPLSR